MDRSVELRESMEEARLEVTAFVQNQREELREIDEAASLSGQGTHQTTYLAGDTGYADAVPYDPKPDGPRYAQMGNAVTVPVAYWIGRRLMERI